MPQLHRKTRRRLEIPQHVRYLTFSCNHRLPLFNNDAIKDEFALTLERVRTRQRFKLIAWVVMPEHVHLLLIPDLPDSPVAKVLKDLKSTFANTILRRWRSLDAPILERITDEFGKPHFWLAGGGYDRNIVSPNEFEEKFNYIHNNPVTRGLVEWPEQWRWSSAAWYADRKAEVLVNIDPFLPW